MKCWIIKATNKSTKHLTEFEVQSSGSQAQVTEGFKTNHPQFEFVSAWVKGNEPKPVIKPAAPVLKPTSIKALHA
jgi:hypothetical protein